MTYLDQWRSQLPSTIERAATRVQPNDTLGPGLLAAVALWPVRADVQAYEGNAIDAVRDVVGPGAGRILVLVRDWSDDLLAAANNLNGRIGTDTELQAACAALEGRFNIASQLAARIAARLAPQHASATQFQGEIRAALLNIGGTVNVGALTVQIHVDAPDPAAQLAAALDTLARLPTDAVPLPAPLPTPQRMPHRHNPQFVGRDDDLKRLAVLLKAQQTTAIVAATGIGGVGKTQLASEFVHRYGQFFRGGVFWIDSSSEAVMRADIAACGEAGALDVPGFGALPDLDTRVRRVQDEWQSAVPRLLVFDNLEDPRLLDLAPTSGGCRVLLTARRTTWSKQSGVTAHPLDVLNRADSLKLLLSPRYGDPARPPLPPVGEGVSRSGGGEGVADAICDALGDLPLPLTLAGAYLQVAASVTLSSYLDTITQDSVAHPSLNDELDQQLPTKHVFSILETFRLSYDQLDDTKPTDALARTLLHRAAHCAPAPIPRRLLVRAAALDPDDEASSTDADRALHRLASLGLIAALQASDDATPPPLRLHRLLGAYVRSRATNEAEDVLGIGRGLIEWALIDELYEVNASGYPQRGQPYLEHVLHCAPAAAARGDERAAILLGNLGNLLQAQGDLHGARPYYEQALAIRKQALGDAHPDMALSLNNLGYLLQAQGDLHGARPYLEQALAIYRQVLGEAHPDTAHSLNNLGALLRAQGDLHGARPYYEQALAIRKQALGDTHPDTALSLSNLGALLQAQGDLHGARLYHEQALAIRKQALGDTHPDTALSLNNLGTSLQAQGDLQGARPYYEQALAINRQVLGDTHPDTARSLNNLAVLFAYQEEFAEAARLMRQALAIRERALGPNHPDSQSSRTSLAAIEARLRGDAPQSVAEQIAGLLEQAEAVVAAALAGSVEQRAAVLAELEQRVQWAEDGKAEGSPYLALAARLRELAAQVRAVDAPSARGGGGDCLGDRGGEEARGDAAKHNLHQ